MVTVWFGVGQFLSGAMGQLYPGGDTFECIFNYKIFESEENDIFIFHIGYLKHNTTMAFPSVLIFKDPPKFIDYEITSKHQPEVIKGRINFNEKRKDR